MNNALVKLHLAVFLAGFTGIFGRLITLNEGLISWYRLFISALVLALLIGIKGISIQVSKKTMIQLGLTGTILGLHWLFFYASIKYANVSIGVVCFALTSFFNALLGPLINKTKFSKEDFFFSGITLLGIALIFGLDAGYRLGVILGVISAIFSALYTIYSEKYTKSCETKVSILYQMGGGCIGLTLIMPIFLYIVPAQSLLPSWTDFGWLILLAVICTIGMYGLILDAFKALSSFTVSLSFNLEPVYAIVLAMMIFQEGEELSNAFFFGVFLILLSVILQTWRTRRQQLRLV